MSVTSGSTSLGKTTLIEMVPRVVPGVRHRLGEPTISAPQVFFDSQGAQHRDKPTEGEIATPPKSHPVLLR